MLLTNEQKNRLIERVKEGTAIYIKGNTPSQKNSKQIFQKRTGEKEFCPKCRSFIKNKTRPFITSSELVKTFVKEKPAEFLKAKVIFKRLIKNVEPPYTLGFFYIRKTKHRFDYGNAHEVILDQFTEYGFWSDDNTEFAEVIPLGFTYSKELAGVIIVVLNGNVKINI